MKTVFFSKSIWKAYSFYSLNHIEDKTVYSIRFIFTYFSLIKFFVKYICFSWWSWTYETHMISICVSVIFQIFIYEYLCCIFFLWNNFLISLCWRAFKKKLLQLLCSKHFQFTLHTCTIKILSHSTFIIYNIITHNCTITLVLIYKEYLAILLLFHFWVKTKR